MKVTNKLGKGLAVGTVLLGALIILAYYYQVAGGQLPLVSGSSYNVSALVSDPQELLKHADVRIDGITVGSVSGITEHGQQALVQMRINNHNAVPVYRNGTVLIRQKTLVGENYVELTRGSPAAGAVANGGMLPQGADQQSVPLDKILNALDGPTRTNIQRDVQAIGGGFAGRAADLNQLLGALNPAITDAAQVTSIFDAQRGQVASIIQDAGTLFDAFAARQADMRTLITAAKGTAVAVNNEDQALRQSFVAFPGALAQARQTVGKLSAFSAQATPVVSNLRVAATALRPVFGDLTPTAEQTRVLFAKLPALLRVADPTLNELRGFSGAAAPTFPALDVLMAQMIPALGYLKPYNADLTSFLANFGTSDEFDKFGAVGSCGCPVSDHSFANWTLAERAAVAPLIDKGLVRYFSHESNDPYRAPGAQPNMSADWAGTYPRISPLPPTPLARAAVARHRAA